MKPHQAFVISPCNPQISLNMQSWWVLLLGNAGPDDKAKALLVHSPALLMRKAAAEETRSGLSTLNILKLQALKRKTPNSSNPVNPKAQPKPSPQTPSSHTIQTFIPASPQVLDPLKDLIPIKQAPQGTFLCEFGGSRFLSGT